MEEYAPRCSACGMTHLTENGLRISAKLRLGSREMRRFATGIAMLMFLVGCSSSSGSPEAEPAKSSSKPSSKPTAQKTEDLPEGAKRVSVSDYGDDWPLTVETGILRCQLGSSVTFNAAGEPVYGLNGTALGQDYPRVDPIWASNPDIPGTKKDIGPLIDDGLKLC